MTDATNKGWPVNRRWSLVQEDNTSAVTIDELLGRRVVVFLGAAGLGKTWELSQLSERERKAGRNVRYHRLAEVATGLGVGVALDAIAVGAGADPCFYLDALDELTASAKASALALQGWLTRAAQLGSSTIRLSCRSAVWPSTLEQAIRETFGEANVAVAVLQPLSIEEVQEIARLSWLDGAAFVESLKASRVVALATFPLTLRMLLRICGNGRQLPTSRREVFRQAIAELSRDSAARRDWGTGNPMEATEVASIAEELACLSLLGGRETIVLADGAGESALGLTDMEHLKRPGRSLDDGALRKVALSGLFEGSGTHRFRFLHRQVAEYLAGRRLAALPPHQAKQLLASGDGVGGPLRETAAFAAMESAELAEWIAGFDPEVIGLSDVADDQLRRLATRKLLEAFRANKLTPSQLGPNGIELKGFRYAGGGHDLRGFLQERGDSSAAMLRCAVAVSEACGYVDELSDSLADLALDRHAPLEGRKAAARALRESGRESERERLKALILDDTDEYEDLKGIAFQCTWPKSLPTQELLGALTRPKRKSYYGSYEMFIGSLRDDIYLIQRDIKDWLGWALGIVTHSDYVFFRSLTRRIVNESLAFADDSEVRRLLAGVALSFADKHVAVLVDPDTDEFNARARRNEPGPLTGKRELCRVVLEAMVEQTPQWPALLFVIQETRGLLEAVDFEWVLGRAADVKGSMDVRILWARVAELLPWKTNQAAVEAWRQVRHLEPVASIMEDPDVAVARWRELDARIAKLTQGERTEGVKSAAEVVARSLDIAESTDARHFLNVARALTLKDGDTHYGFNRFLVTTPGWERADLETRRRIVQSAVRFLELETDVPEACVEERLNAILAPHMMALLLVLEQDRGWLEGRLPGWWERWCWYLVREARPTLSGEPDDPKKELFAVLWKNASAQVRLQVVRTATEEEPGLGGVLGSCLQLLIEHGDAVLDNELCAAASQGRVRMDRLGQVLEFLIARGWAPAFDLCVELARGAGKGSSIEVRIAAVSALLVRAPEARWRDLVEVLRRDAGLGARAFGDYAHRADRDGVAVPITNLGETRIGELLVLVFAWFSPSTDPDYDDAHWVSSNDSARTLRGRLMNWLMGRGTRLGLEALRQLEIAHGKEHSFLRRIVADAARDLRLASWVPLPPASVAAILVNAEKRLVASEREAMEAIVFALSKFEASLQGSPALAQALWDKTPKGVQQKDEEFVSDMICSTIRAYFTGYAVTADREVQVYRRVVAEGASGSRPDVLVRVQAQASAGSAPIAIPLEVKKSGNPEARTGLKEQLVKRYLAEVGTRAGVFVVAWMDAPGLDAKLKPKWASIDEARRELEGQAQEVAPDGLIVTPVVLNASLR